MNRKIIFLSFFALAFCAAVYAQSEQNVVLTNDEYKSIIQRLEALEKRSDTVDAESGATKRVDAESGATSVRRQAHKEANDTTKHAHQRPSWIHNRLTIGGYGEVTMRQCFYSDNYLRYGKNPERFKGDRYGQVDLPHVVIYLGYDFGKGWSMGSEIEFEHGGPEVATEIEEEEGGEYESEIERGGEVALEQFWLQKKFNDYAVIRVGMQVVPVGALNAHHEPIQFFTVYRPEGEYTIIPSTWHEVALTFMGKTQWGLSYQAMFLPGLDSDRFNRKNWIKSGAGSPYEFKLATVFAGAARIDYTGIQGLRLSLSGYAGNSFRNTLSMSTVEIENSAYKNVHGTVTVGSFDVCYNDHNWIVRAQATYGHLGDAAAITRYNIAMRKGSVSSKQWVASDAIAAGCEFGYDFFALNQRLREHNQRFYVFGRYEYYDSMFRYDGKRDYTYSWCGRHRAACGFNYFPMREIAIKAEFAYGILNKGIRADGSKGKLYNDEPLVAFGITYAGMFKL